ncbi:hypothetical protein N7475_004594 [Penicillium sp. IBT 31633x]|nr:hypothetical protein N7475_004594 [Penicillium sp. IBT 31633x]
MIGSEQDSHGQDRLSRGAIASQGLEDREPAPGDIATVSGRCVKPTTDTTPTASTTSTASRELIRRDISAKRDGDPGLSTTGLQRLSQPNPIIGCRQYQSSYASKALDNAASGRRPCFVSLLRA